MWIRFSLENNLCSHKKFAKRKTLIYPIFWTVVGKYNSFPNMSIEETHQFMHKMKTFTSSRTKQKSLKISAKYTYRFHSKLCVRLWMICNIMENVWREYFLFNIHTFKCYHFGRGIYVHNHNVFCCRTSSHKQQNIMIKFHFVSIYWIISQTMNETFCLKLISLLKHIKDNVFHLLTLYIASRQLWGKCTWSNYVPLE